MTRGRLWGRGGAAAGILVVLALAGVSLLFVSLRPGALAQSPTDRTFAASGLSFTYPASWHLTDVRKLLRYETVLAYVGTGKGSLTCGSDYIAGMGGTCPETITLEPNTFVVKVSEWAGPRPSPVVAEVLKTNAAATATTIAGHPAAVYRVDPSHGADLVVRWLVDRPEHTTLWYVVTAFINGPDVGPSRSLVERLVGSISLSTDP